jgi:transcriptional regulator with XRE-family HTH domain
VAQTDNPIRSARKVAGLSQQSVAEKVGVSIGTVRGWDAGRAVSSQYVRKVSEVLDIPVDVILRTAEAI